MERSRTYRHSFSLPSCYEYLVNQPISIFLRSRLSPVLLRIPLDIDDKGDVLVRAVVGSDAVVSRTILSTIQAGCDQLHKLKENLLSARILSPAKA